MLGRGVGLIELVGEPPDGAYSPWSKCYRDHVARLVSCGLIGEGSRVVLDVSTMEDTVGNDPVSSEAARYAQEEAVSELGRSELWIAYADRIDLAADLDTFLAVREADSRTFTLARDCRRELDLLLILADLCEDLQMPRSAIQARHLHRQACELRR